MYIEELGFTNTLKSEYLVPTNTFKYSVKPIQSYNNSFEALIRDLTKYRKDKYRILILSGSRTRAERLAKDFGTRCRKMPYIADPFKLTERNTKELLAMLK